MELANLLGKEEHGISSNEESLILRLMMPVVKLYTAKKVRVWSHDYHMIVISILYSVLQLHQKDWKVLVDLVTLKTAVYLPCIEILRSVMNIFNKVRIANP